MKANTTLTRKPGIIFLALMILFGSKSFGQQIEFTAFAGGTFAAGVNNYSTYYSNAQIDGSAHYGGSLDFFIRNDVSINLTGFNQPTTGRIYGGVTGYQTMTDPMDVTYILLGANKYAGRGKVKIFGGFGLGVGVLSATDYSSATRFAVDVHGGIKIDASEHIGLRFQLQLDSPIDGGGYGIGVGPNGTVVGVSTYSSIVQFGGNAGIVFRFGHK